VILISKLAKNDMEYKRDLFKGNNRSIFHLILGLAVLVMSILWIITRLAENDSLKPFDWFYSSFFLLFGIAHIFLGFGTSIERFLGKSFVHIDNDIISIKFGAFEKEKKIYWHDILSINYVPHRFTFQLKDNSAKVISLTRLDNSRISDIKETITKIATDKEIKLIIK
jgi:hypothetical protein